MHLRVLIIGSSNHEQTKPFSVILNELGHQVVAQVNDAGQALLKSSELSPDMVLMDLDSKGLAGLDAVRRMNQAGRLPIVITTREPNQKLAAKAADAGVYAYLVKPLDAAVLGPALELAYLTYQKETTLERQLVDLKKELIDRKYISRAVGNFMDNQGLSEKEAMEMLETQAQLSRMSPAELAAKIIDRQNQGESGV